MVPVNPQFFNQDEDLSTLPLKKIAKSSYSSAWRTSFQRVRKILRINCFEKRREAADRIDQSPRTYRLASPWKTNRLRFVENS